MMIKGIRLGINIAAILVIMLALQSCALNTDTRRNIKTDYAQGNYRLMVEDLHKLAAQGDPPSQYGLGYAYYNGLGVAQDRDLGRYWIRRAANAGYPPAVTAYRDITNTDTETPTYAQNSNGGRF